MTKAEIINASLSSKSQTNPSKSPQLESKEQDIENCFTQSQDTMIFNYLMGEAAKKGWKVGCRFEFDGDKNYIAQKFSLGFENKRYYIKVHSQHIFCLDVNECIPLPDKLMFNGKEVGLSYSTKKANLYFCDSFQYMRLEDMILFKEILNPDRQKELGAIIKELEK